MAGHRRVQAVLDVFPAEIRGRRRNSKEPMNIQQMMKQAQQMQERLQKQMAEMRVEATAGGGMVTVVVNGAKQMQSLKIDPEVVSKDDVEMLQDLIVAAINDAHRKVDEALSAADGRHDGRPEDPGHVLTDVAVPIRSTRLVEQLQRLPGIGAQERAAPRVPHPARRRARTPTALCDAMRDVKDRVTYCSICNNITDVDPCRYCTDDDRDHRAHLRRRGAAERRRRSRRRATSRASTTC